MYILYIFTSILLSQIWAHNWISLWIFINAGLERVHGFTFGDSLDENRRNKWLDFKTRLTKV